MTTTDPDQASASPAAPATPAADAWYAQSPQDVATHFDVDPAVGLSAAKAAALLTQHGPNALPAEKPKPEWRRFLDEYRSYMQITCLEMERARRTMERKSASRRIALIDARLGEIDKAKQDLFQAVAARGHPIPGELPGLDLKPAPRRSAGGFKIRY